MHLDEGTIHAWIDGALDAEEAARVERHAAECGACAAAVAEARGLVAGASRILTALDGVPGGVVPKTASAGDAPRARRTRSFWTTLHLTPARAAAAAVIVVAAGTALVVRNAPNADRSAIRLANYPTDSAVTFQAVPPMTLPHAAVRDSATSREAASAREAPKAARVMTTEPTSASVPTSGRRTAVAVGQGAGGRAGGVAVAEQAKAAAENAARGAVTGAKSPAPAAPPSAVAQPFAEKRTLASVPSAAGCYVVTADSAIALPARLWLDSAVVAQPAMLQRSKAAAADASVMERHGVSEIVNDARRSIVSAYWARRPDGSVLLSLPAMGLNVDLRPTSAETLAGATAVGSRTVTVTLRRAACDTR